MPEAERGRPRHTAPLQATVRAVWLRSRLLSTFRQVLGLVSGLAPLLYPGREDPHLSPPQLSLTGTYPNDGVVVRVVSSARGPDPRCASSVATALQPILGLAETSTCRVLSECERRVLGRQLPAPAFIGPDLERQLGRVLPLLVVRGPLMLLRPQGWRTPELSTKLST